MGSKSVYETEGTRFLPPMDTYDLAPDVQDLCRLCMSSEQTDAGAEMVAVSEKYPNSDIAISSLFIESLNIDVNDSPSPFMPKKVCTKCLHQLFNYSKFKKHCLCIDAKLRQIVCQKQKLAEAQALYGPAFFDLDTASQYADSSTYSTLYFETIDEGGPHSCAPPFQAAGDNVDVTNIEEIEASLNEESSVIADFQTECETTGPDQEDSPVGSDEDVEENRTNSASESVSMVISNIESAPLGSCNTENRPESAIDESFSTDVICEVVVFDSTQISETDEVLAGEEPASKVVCPGVPVDSTLVNDLLSKKCSHTPSLVPEVCVVEHKTAINRLAFKCSFCSKVFKSRNVFRKHAASHIKAKGMVCKFCDKWFPTSHALTRHERIHSGEKPFECILCNRSFSQREILQRHILTHTDKKPFQCKYCDKSYAQKNGLIKHVKYNHQPPSEISLYPCHLCSKAFCHQSGLSRHMFAHAGRQYDCKFCDLKYSDSSALRRHVKSKHEPLLQS